MHVFIKYHSHHRYLIIVREDGGLGPLAFSSEKVNDIFSTDQRMYISVLRDREARAGRCMAPLYWLHVKV